MPFLVLSLKRGFNFMFFSEVKMRGFNFIFFRGKNGRPGEKARRRGQQFDDVKIIIRYYIQKIISVFIY